jgi:hypothetical protein
MEIIDVLATTNINGGIDERQNFTVNNLVADVSLNAFVGGSGRLRPAFSTNYKIAPKDNITILSMGITLPYSFSLSTRIPYVKLNWFDATGSGGLPFGSSANTQLPFANYELSCGNFVPWPTPRLLPYYITMLLGQPPLDVAENQVRVSMAGIPAIIPNGAVLPVTCWIKISHNLPLVP